MLILCLVAMAATVMPGFAQFVELPAPSAALVDARDAAELRLSRGSQIPVALQLNEPEERLPFSNCVRVDVRAEAETAESAQLMAPVRGSIRKGDVIAIEMYVRGTAARSKALTAYGEAYLQEGAGEKPRILGGESFYAGTAWRQVIIAFEATADSNAGTILALNLGSYAQTVEFGGVRVLSYGRSRTVQSLPSSPVPYSGMEADAPWRKDAEERIEQIRKGDLTVRVTDATGRPAANAKVHVKMRRHAFGFGTAVRARQLADFEDRQMDRYRFVVENYFNRVVFENDLKWAPWETAKANTDREYRKVWMDAAFAWLKERTIGARGHYGAAGPLDAEGRGPGAEPEAFLPQRILAHIDEKFAAVGDRVIEWDVLNHPVGNWAPTLERRFGLDLYADIFRRARERVPSSTSVWVNESAAIEGGGRRGEYERLLHDLVAKGADITGVGFMGHFDPASVRGIEEMYADFDRFAAIVPNLQFTELDFDTSDEQLQAQYLRDVITIAFSHSNFCGILQWGFWESSHWRPNAALWRQDWSIKPAGEAYLDLVNKKWWTDVEIRTGADGVARVRGFLGAYDIVVIEGSRTATVSTQLVHDGTWVDVALK